MFSSWNPPLLVPRLSSGLLLSLYLAGHWHGGHAYIPALPSNGTGPPLNSTPPSHLALRWYGGGYFEDVSYQLVGSQSNGVSSGALLHFSESELGNDTTTTPWIALISCDANSTDASADLDIFTQARDRGAVSALLYSIYSDHCIISPEYADPQNFDNILDIFSTPSLSASQMIEVEYKSLNQSRYQNLNATLLNETAAIVNASLASATLKEPNYLFATLISGANSTGDNGNGISGTAPSNGTSNSGHGLMWSAHTSIGLYGLITSLACASLLMICT